MKIHPTWIYFLTLHITYHFFASCCYEIPAVGFRFEFSYCASVPHSCPIHTDAMSAVAGFLLCDVVAVLSKLLLRVVFIPQSVFHLRTFYIFKKMFIDTSSLSLVFSFAFLARQLDH